MSPTIQYQINSKQYRNRKPCHEFLFHGSVFIDRQSVKVSTAPAPNRASVLDSGALPSHESHPMIPPWPGPTMTGAAGIRSTATNPAVARFRAERTTLAPFSMPPSVMDPVLVPPTSLPPPEPLRSGDFGPRPSSSSSGAMRCAAASPSASRPDARRTNADLVAGRDRVRVQGTLHEHTGHGLAEQVARTSIPPSTAGSTSTPATRTWCCSPGT